MRWILYLPIYLATWLVKFPLSIIAVLLLSTADRKHLTTFQWLETIDNDLSGDAGWKAEHITGDALSNWNRIKWLWRNGGNSLNYSSLGCNYLATYGYPDATVYLPHTGSFWKRADGYWFFHKLIPISSTRQLELMFGWNIFGPQLNRCKYVCTIRFPSIK